MTSPQSGLAVMCNSSGPFLALFKFSFPAWPHFLNQGEQKNHCLSMTGSCQWSKDTRKANTSSAPQQGRHDVNSYAYQFRFSINIIVSKTNLIFTVKSKSERWLKSHRIRKVIINRIRVGTLFCLSLESKAFLLYHVVWVIIIARTAQEQGSKFSLS